MCEKSKEKSLRFCFDGTRRSVRTNAISRHRGNAHTLDKITTISVSTKNIMNRLRSLWVYECVLEYSSDHLSKIKVPKWIWKNKSQNRWNQLDFFHQNREQESNSIRVSANDGSRTRHRKCRWRKKELVFVPSIAYGRAWLREYVCGPCMGACVRVYTFDDYGC